MNPWSNHEETFKMSVRKIAVLLLTSALAPAGLWAKNDGKDGGNGGNGNKNASSQRVQVHQGGNGGRGPVRVSQGRSSQGRNREDARTVEFNRAADARTSSRSVSVNNRSKKDTVVVYNHNGNHSNVKVRPTARLNNNRHHGNQVVVYNRNGRSYRVERTYYGYGNGYYGRPYYGGYYGRYYGGGYGGYWGPSFLGLSFPIYSNRDYAQTYAYNDDGDNAPPVEVLVQQRLAHKGFYRGPIDGIIGSGSRRAIADYQYSVGLSATGRIDDSLLDSLGIE